MRRIRAIEVNPVGSLCRRLHDDEGVTLVEMMVAILILGIVLTALAGTLVTSLTSAGRQEADIQANAVANAVLEDLHALSFQSVALCTGEAAASFETEAMVLLPSSDPQCSEADRPVPTFSVVQDGRSYDGVLAITWIDDPATAAAQDYKRLVVDLTWEDRGRNYTSRTEARRAPEALEQPMTVEVTPFLTRLRHESEAESGGVRGRIASELQLRASHAVEQSSVVVSWLDRDGDPDTLALTSSDGGFTWVGTLPANYIEPFPNGETLFAFAATDSSGVTTDVVTRALFLHDLGYLEVVGPEPSPVDVDPAGVICGGATLTVRMMGMLLSDTVEVAFSHEGDPAEATTPRYALSGVLQTVSGADFEMQLNSATTFPVGVATTVTGTLFAERVVNPPSPDPLEATFSFAVQPVEACP